jgi:hypothetical protein
MGGVYWRVKSQEIVELTTTTPLKMEDACILCNVIETLMKKNDQGRKMKAFWRFQAPNGIGTIM